MRRKKNTPKVHCVLKLKTSKLPEVLENGGDQSCNWLSFASEWFRAWCKLCGQITERSNKNYVIPDYS